MTENTLIAYIATVVAAVLFGFMFLVHLDIKDATLIARANCIAATAKAEGYTGNVHGEEAWRLFADKCR